MIPEKEGPHFQAAWNFLSILALGLVVFLSLEPRLLYPLGDNEGFYSYYASQMGKGLRLYRDLWDHKPPGLFLQYFLLGRVLLLDEAHLRLFVCLVHILNAVLLMGLGRRLGFTRPAAWGAAFLYALFLYPALLQPWSAEADLLGLPFLIAALLLAHSTREAALFFSGALFAMAFLTKQSAALVFPVFLTVRNLRSLRSAGLGRGACSSPSSRSCFRSYSTAGSRIFGTPSPVSTTFTSPAVGISSFGHRPTKVSSSNG